MKRLSLFLAMALAPAFAQSSVEGPWLGLVYDAGQHGVRLVRGIASSATLSLRAHTADLSIAVASPSGYALGVEAKTGAALMITPRGMRQLAGAAQAASRLAVSPAGNSAALYFEDALKVQVFTGLPEAPQLAREEQLDAAASALAISDDASLLAVAQDAGLAGFRADGGRSPLLPVSGVTGVTFAGSGSDLLAATSDAVWLIRNGSSTRLMDADHPVGIAASADGSRVFVAMPSGRVVVSDMNGGIPKP